MKTASYHILRVGMAITFIWIGILIIKSPESWGGYVQPWVTNFLPIPLEQIMIGTAIFDIVIGILFLVDWQVWVAGLLAALHLLTVLIVSGITDITVRDIGLLAATLVLMLDSLPIGLMNIKIIFKKNNHE